MSEPQCSIIVRYGFQCRRRATWTIRDFYGDKRRPVCGHHKLETRTPQRIPKPPTVVAK